MKLIDDPQFIYNCDNNEKKTFFRRTQCHDCQSWILNYELDCYITQNYSQCCTFAAINWSLTILYLLYIIIAFFILIIFSTVCTTFIGAFIMLLSKINIDLNTIQFHNLV